MRNWGPTKQYKIKWIGTSDHVIYDWGRYRSIKKIWNKFNSMRVYKLCYWSFMAVYHGTLCCTHRHEYATCIEFNKYAWSNFSTRWRKQPNCSVKLLILTFTSNFDWRFVDNALNQLKLQYYFEATGLCETRWKRSQIIHC